MAASSHAAEYVRAVMMEIVSIAQSAGYSKITSETVDWQMGRAKARPLPGIEPSMLADALAGRQMEADAIVGNAIRIADANGIQAPLLKANYVLLQALNESFRRTQDAQRQGS